MRRHLLIVSENPDTRAALARRLREAGSAVTLASNDEEALDVVRTVAVDAVLIDSRPHDPRARRLGRRMRAERPEVRVVQAAGFDRARPHAMLRFGPEDFLVTSDALIDLLQGSTGSDGPEGFGSRGVGSLVQVIDVLVGLLELDDRYFGGSSHQAMRLARAVAEEIGVESEVAHEVTLAALLRDIGKAGVDVEVLEEAGELTEEQMDLMREHVSGSVRLLEHIDLPWKVLPVIRHHHERYDGTGYPDGLRGREIPIGARILSVVDAYVAMTSERSHRPSREPQEALAEIESEIGSQFDPEVVEVFFKVAERRAARGSSKKPRVLLAEPDTEYRNLIKMRLLNEGIQVEAVARLGRARKKLLKNPPNLVLASMEPDDAEVLRLLRDVREHRSLQQLPFVVLGRHNDRILKIRALRQGVDDFLLKSDDLEELVARVENILAREACRTGTAAGRRRGVSGTLESMSLADIVQTLSIGMKTAGVDLTTADTTGRIWFRDGKICHAECGELSGEAAFFELLRWRSGEFVIQHGAQSPATTIENDPMYLVLEGMRRVDHERAEAS